MKVEVIGQRSRSPYQKSVIIKKGFYKAKRSEVTRVKVKGHMKVTWFKVKVTGVKVKGHMDQDQIRILKKRQVGS